MALSPLSEKSVITVSNAIELVTKIVEYVGGREVADTLNNNPVSRAEIQQLVAAQFAKRISGITSRSKGK